MEVGDCDFILGETRYGGFHGLVGLRVVREEYIEEGSWDLQNDVSHRDRVVDERGRIHFVKLVGLEQACFCALDGNNDPALALNQYISVRSRKIGEREDEELCAEKLHKKFRHEDSEKTAKMFTVQVAAPCTWGAAGQRLAPSAGKGSTCI